MKDPDKVRMGRLNKSRSKSVEREWGKAFNTRRLDAIAGSGSRQSDLRYTSPSGLTYDIEVKQRLRPSFTLYDEAVLKADKDSIPVLGLEIRQGNRNDRFCLLSRDDFCRIVGAKPE